MASAASAGFLEGIHPLFVAAGDAERQVLANGIRGTMSMAFAAFYLIANRVTLGGGPIYAGITSAAAVVFDLDLPVLGEVLARSARTKTAVAVVGLSLGSGTATLEFFLLPRGLRVDRYWAQTAIVAPVVLHTTSCIRLMVAAGISAAGKRTSQLCVQELQGY